MHCPFGYYILLAVATELYGHQVSMTSGVIDDVHNAAPSEHTDQAIRMTKLCTQ